MVALYLLIIVVGAALISKHDQQQVRKHKDNIINNRIKRKIAKSHRIDVRV